MAGTRASRNGGQSGTISKRQVCLIQTLRRQAGIDDETWSQMKASVGVESTKELEAGAFEELLGRIEGRAESQGGQPPGGRTRPKSWKRVHKSAFKSGMHRRPPQETEAMIRKIEAILAEFKLGWDYADGMARRMFGIDRLAWCDAGQTYKVLQALCVYQRRAG